jgi:hypothetical protein
VKYATLAASFLVPLAAVVTAAQNAPIRVRLSDNVYATGDRARVNVRTEKDGFLVVLGVDAGGTVRVLFPVDPGNDTKVRGGKEIEVRSRGGREAFTVSEKTGAGLVFAARADTPFNFAPFMAGQHWDFNALVPADANGDPEAALVSLVDRMGDGHYDYDAIPYKVDSMAAHRRPGYAAIYDPWYPPMYRGFLGFGGFYSSWPWLYGPGFGATIVVPIRSFRGRRR